MEKLINMFKKDDTALSIGRVCAVGTFLAFIGVSVYLAVIGRTWGNYEAFSVGCVGYIIAQLGNKYVEMRGVKIGDKEGMKIGDRENG
nr:MAG TPA: hypothetical protein [Caudoviricetes sp.]